MHININGFRKLVLYGGVEKEEFHALTPSIHKENQVLLGVFSPLAGVMFFLLFIMSMLLGGFATVNTPTYLTCGLFMLVITFCVLHAVPKYPALVTVLVYLFEIALYVFSITISMLHADKPAVSAVAFLLVSPLLFYDRPLRLCGLIAAVVASFCATVLCFKDPITSQTDVWNMVTFGIVAVATTIFTMRVKIRSLAQSMEIEHLSQTDLLTGSKNRNHYEKQLQKYPEMCSSNMICVYGDVNGLHEINNRKGHVAGDSMLREVAAAMQSYFGLEHTYRVGGDEFIAVGMDIALEDVSTELERIRQELAAKGYHVAFGVAVREIEEGPFDMAEVVKEAESNMFSAKREFYRQPEHNRRSR